MTSLWSFLLFLSNAASETCSLKYVFLKSVKEPYFANRLKILNTLFGKAANFRSTTVLTLSLFAVMFQRFYPEVQWHHKHLFYFSTLFFFNLSVTFEQSRGVYRISVTFEIELFVTLINGFQPLTNVTNNSILILRRSLIYLCALNEECMMEINYMNNINYINFISLIFKSLQLIIVVPIATSFSSL